MCEADGDRPLQKFELRPSSGGIYFRIDLGAAAARYHHRQAERKQDARGLKVSQRRLTGDESFHRSQC